MVLRDQCEVCGSWAKNLKFHSVSYVGQLHSNYVGFNMMRDYEVRDRGLKLY